MGNARGRARTTAALAFLVALAARRPARADGDPPVTITPRGALVINLGYNRGTLLPGPYGYFAVPPALSRPQFYVSPSNTVLGFYVVRPAQDGAAVSAALDLSLRSSNVFQGGSNLAP